MRVKQIVNVDGFYKLDFDSSTFDSYLKDL